MTLEEKMTPSEVDRLRVENEHLKEELEWFAANLLANILVGDPAALVIVCSCTPRLVKRGAEVLPDNTSITTTLARIEAVLTPEDTLIRDAMKQIRPGS